MNMKMKTVFRLTAAVALLLAHRTVYADSWVLKPEVKDTEFEFGGTRIVLHYDSTTNRRFPKYEIRVYARNQLLATHENMGFEQVFADPQNTYFLGVSNSGLIKQAYIVFDNQGRLIKEQKHDPRKVHYTRMSVTVRREWYDAKTPQPEFVVRDGKLSEVRIQGTEGKKVSLMLNPAVDEPQRPQKSQR